MSPRLTFLITDLHRGGSPLLLAALAPGLAAKGFDVEVVSIAREGEVATLLRQRGIHVYSLFAESSGDLNVFPRFLHYLRQRKPHIVASILIHANLLATLACPFIRTPTAWVHSIHTLQERPRWHWYLQGLLCSFADSFIAPSHAVIHKLERYGPVPRPTVIPNGIDVPRFRDAMPMPPAERPWPAKAFVVGYIGRFDPVKRLPVLLEAAAILARQEPARCRPLHVALVGYGEQENALRQQAAALHITNRVHFVSATHTPERWYKSFDLFCSPSPAEGFGLTLAEARSAGIPVIACRTSAVVETLDEAYWLPEDATPQDVAHAISSGMELPQTPKIPPERLLERYSIQAMVNAYYQHFLPLLPTAR